MTGSSRAPQLIEPRAPEEARACIARERAAEAAAHETQTSRVTERLTQAGFGLWFLAFTLANTLVSTLVLATALSWPFVDALYYVVTALTTVGFGDLGVADAGAWLKLYVIYLMLCGAGSYSVLLAILVNRVVQLNLRDYFEGRRRKSMRDHVVLCGLGNLGSRILEELEEQGEEVVVIECNESNRFVKRCRARGVRVIIDDSKVLEVLQEAGVAEAKCIVLATDHDLDNLESALVARDINPDIRVVIRMYDRSLARRLDQVFNFGRTFSASEIAAPQFANAVTTTGFAAKVQVHEKPFLVYELQVAPVSPLEGLTCGELTDRLGASVMDIKREGDFTQPTTSTRLVAGDDLVVALRKERLSELLELNRA